MWKYEVDTTNTSKKEGRKMKNDTFTLGGKEFSSRFILGSGKYSMELIKAADEALYRAKETHNGAFRQAEER